MAASMALKMASALHDEPSDDLICAPFACLRQRRRRLQGMMNSVTNRVRSPVNRSQDSHQGRKAAVAGPVPWPDPPACQCWPDVGNGALAARWQVWWQSLSGFLLNNYILCKRFGTHCQGIISWALQAVHERGAWHPQTLSSMHCYAGTYRL